ncbi:nucleoid-associated protein [Paracoccus sp. MBLB3053]|uniref:Nucleoid-associated protein n=1 Tax=Paracoccus aurantius TaxID=3073814 RepID=A0ABU2HQK4_9RHOB|nr:nucleoid-associated protein [Paracoccus sp. MBLB3053]MDS9467318.1 nucleoid-associated protein [Paracoccus sp. MBLB3053]
MSLHIIGGEGDFEPQPELAVVHDDFLLVLLKGIASEPVYKFKEASQTKETVRRLAKGDLTFERGAQLLAEDFCRFHATSNAKDGAFFVFELAIDFDDRTRYFALIKYDYSQALELIHQAEGNGLRRIVEAFAGSKASIQKSAIVRVVDGNVDSQISTHDRMGKPQPILTDFFTAFLQVERERDDEELTRAAKEVVRSAIRDHQDLLPAGKVASAIARANHVLRAAPEISEDVVKQAVWVGMGQPEDEATKAKLDAASSRLLKRYKLNGVAFSPAAGVLPQSVKRQVITDEGVKIEYNTALEGQSVVVEPLETGGTRFTITTKGYKDDVSSEKLGR